MIRLFRPNPDILSFPIDQADLDRPSAENDEAMRDKRHPLSRWYACPLARVLASRLAACGVHPNTVTWIGLACWLAGASLLTIRPEAGAWVAGLVMLGWLCDRTDGRLARMTGRTSPWGAWLDANLDEVTDVAMHVAIGIAAAATGMATTVAAAGWVVAFVAGKFLFHFGRHQEQAVTTSANATDAVVEEEQPVATRSGTASLLRSIWHLPGNTDVRVHALALCLLAGWSWAALVYAAAYYNIRWVAGFVLTARRLRDDAHRPTDPTSSGDDRPTESLSYQARLGARTRWAGSTSSTRSIAQRCRGERSASIAALGWSEGRL